MERSGSIHRTRLPLHNAYFIHCLADVVQCDRLWLTYSAIDIFGLPDLGAAWLQACWHTGGACAGGQEHAEDGHNRQIRSMG